MEIIIAVLSSAVISSIVTALLAPHVNWGIEKKKIRLQNQKELIHNLRNILDKEDFSREDFRNTQIYTQIRPFLSSQTIETVESSVIHVDRDIGVYTNLKIRI